MGKKNNNNSGANRNKSTPAPAPTDAVEVIPEEFKKVICDFINDFGLTFPEYSEKLDKYSSVDSSGSGRRTISDDNITELYQHCKKVYPVRFFDILYKNVEVFKKRDSGAAEVNVHFLPEVDFANVIKLARLL